jgi:UDP-galactose transporter B1
MARTKSSAVKRTPSETFKQGNGTAHKLNGVVENVEREVEEYAESQARDSGEKKEAGLLALVVCVGGIYVSL